MGYYIHTVIVFVIGNTIRKAVVTVMIGNYIHRVVVIEGSLFSREYGISICVRYETFSNIVLNTPMLCGMWRIIRTDGQTDGRKDKTRN